MNRLFICLILLPIFVLSCKKESEVDDLSKATLREYATYPVGNIYRENERDFYNWKLNGDNTLLGKTGFGIRDQYKPPIKYEILESEFTSITPETCLKMHIVSQGPDENDFSKADAFVAYAKKHNMRIHGHVLIWTASVPEWIRHVDWTEEQYEEWLEKYIKTVVSRYKDDIKYWDVINEPMVSYFTAAQKDKSENFWRYHIGDDYIEKAFKWAEEANPDALFFINENGMETAGGDDRRKAFIRFVNNLRENGAKVDGIGLQFHLISPDIGLVQLKKVFDDVTSQGYLLHLSELDILMNFPFGTKKELTQTDQKTLSRAYNNIAYAYHQYVPKEKQHGITLWGISDINTAFTLYLNFKLNQKAEDFPHLWDNEYNRKPAYYGFLKGLRGIKGI